MSNGDNSSSSQHGDDDRHLPDGVFDSERAVLNLSELVLAVQGAENRFAAIEDLSDDELHDRPSP